MISLVGRTLGHHRAERGEHGLVDRRAGDDLVAGLQVRRRAGVGAMLVLKPRSADARAEASTHMLVIIPQITTSSTPAERRSPSSEVSRNALAWALTISGSPVGGLDRRMDLDAFGVGREERRVGRVPDVLDVEHRLAARPEGASSSLARPAAASAPTSSILPPGK